MALDSHGLSDETAAGLLRRVADELEIRNLVARIFLLTDEGADLDLIVDCYTPDAIWEASSKDGAISDSSASLHKRTRLVGRDEIRADRAEVRARGVQGAGTGAHHLITTLEVRVGDDDTAEAESHWMFVRREPDQVKLLHVGSYFDRFRRMENHWKLAHRRFF